MSRIGRKSIPVPANVKVAVKTGEVAVSGPLGTLTTKLKPEVRVSHDEAKKEIAVSLAPGVTAESRLARALWGTTRALIASNIKGVTAGYSKEMEVVGVGWTAAVQGANLKMTLGFANSIVMPIPKGLKVNVEKQIVKVEGPDKQMVGHFAAEMRSHRKPEPYNGKGVKYRQEVIKRKSGKAFGTA
ncbi:MAG: 50S ribosomal protein L6 [Planctomyces sp.]|nr:50S ribosomal protein L6 [Planctomyces sp.]